MNEKTKYPRRDGRHRRHLKQAMFRHLAADYLSNIEVHGAHQQHQQQQEQQQHEHYESLAGDTFRCFLNLDHHLVLARSSNNTFLHFYKRKQMHENERRDRLARFLNAEFANWSAASSYVSEFLAPSAHTIQSRARQQQQRKASNHSASRGGGVVVVVALPQPPLISIQRPPTTIGGQETSLAAAASAAMQSVDATEYGYIRGQLASLNAAPCAAPTSSSSRTRHATSSMTLSSTSSATSIHDVAGACASHQLQVQAFVGGGANKMALVQARLAATAGNKNNKTLVTNKLSQPIGNERNPPQQRAWSHYKRTVSESSNESSNYLTASGAYQRSSTAMTTTAAASTLGGPTTTVAVVDSSMSNSVKNRTLSVATAAAAAATAAASTYANRMTRGTQLFACLKRLAGNEKVMFASNGSHTALFSRLPFRANNRGDLNESFIMSHRARNTSISKATGYLSHMPNQFMLNVFETLGLEFDDYLNTGSMSYGILVDAVGCGGGGDSATTGGVGCGGGIVSADINEQTTSNANNPSNNPNNTGNTNFGVSNTSEMTAQSSTLAAAGVAASSDNKEDELNKSCGKKENSPFSMTTRAEATMLTASASSNYQADYLDDPQLTELTAGKNRTCLKFASYAVSIIDYVKPLDLKKEINETFKEKFPYIQISLTKLRSIKRELLEIVVEASIDLVVVAQAYIYFEKLILMGLINKPNRKHLAANALILAAKLNDVTKRDIGKLIDVIVTKFRLDTRKELIAYEFAILVALEFNLMVRYENDFHSHYERLSSSLDAIRPVNYLINDQ